MKYLLIIPVLAVMFVPFTSHASEALTCDEGQMVQTVSHTEYSYQEQIDIDPRGGYETWVNVGSPTAWTSDTTVDGHGADVTFSVTSHHISVTHRWHVADERSVSEDHCVADPDYSAPTPEVTQTHHHGGSTATPCYYINVLIGKNVCTMTPALQELWKDSAIRAALMRLSVTI